MVYPSLWSQDSFNISGLDNGYFEESMGLFSTSSFSHKRGLSDIWKAIQINHSNSGVDLVRNSNRVFCLSCLLTSHFEP